MGETVFQRLKTFGRHFSNHKRPLHASLSNNGSQDGESLPKKKEMDTFEFEQCPHVTRFKNPRTSVWRVEITGSPQLQQVTDWLSEIDQATSRQGFDEAGSAFDCTRMQLETLDSPSCARVMKIMHSEFQRKVQVAEEMQETHVLPMLTGRQTAPSSRSTRHKGEPLA